MGILNRSRPRQHRRCGSRGVRGSGPGPFGPRLFNTGPKAGHLPLFASIPKLPPPLSKILPPPRGGGLWLAYIYNVVAYKEVARPSKGPHLMLSHPDKYPLQPVADSRLTLRAIAIGIWLN